MEINSGASDRTAPQPLGFEVKGCELSARVFSAHRHLPVEHSHDFSSVMGLLKMDGRRKRCLATSAPSRGGYSR